MVRVSRNLRHAANLLLCAALVGGCSTKADAPSTPPGRLISNLISFSPAIYSAYDGVHDYQIVPNVPTADPKLTGAANPEPIDGNSLKWIIDSAFLKEEVDTDIPGARLFTTKKAGTTKIQVTGKTVAGEAIRGETTLTISQANDSEWQAGDMRYSNGMAIDFRMLFAGGAAGGMGSCGLPFDLGAAFPKTSACANCHDGNSGITIEHTPEQTAGYSNDDLVQIFTMGVKPAGFTFNSPFLKMAPMPDCIYKSFHTWDIDDATKKGIVWKLRSIKPAMQMQPNLAGIVGMLPGRGAAGAAAPAAGGAAGSGM